MNRNLRSVVVQLAVATVVFGGVATPATAATIDLRNGRVVSSSRTAASGSCPTAVNRAGNPLGGTGNGGTRNAHSAGLNAVGNPLGGTGDGGTRNAYGDGLNSVGNPLGGTGDGGTANARC